MNPTKTLLAVLIAGLFAPPLLAADKSSEGGSISIVGEGDRLGNGLMVEEDGVKARSVVTKAAIEKAIPTANPFQLLNMQPGVNASSYDATGLFGGNLRVRGFNSDQMGFTINGAPVNDSGNFAVFPQEYSDSENLCELFITQGSADTDAPHVGASGGNVGLVSCGPKDKFGGKFSQTVGELSLSRTFIRVDTGKIGETNPFKAFVSYSKSQADKFKGEGKADRDHVDAGIAWKLGADTDLTASLLYNHAVNNNYMTLSKAQWLQNPKADFTTAIPQHLVSGNESTTANFGTSGIVKPAYYGYALNPFENYLFTARLQTRVMPNLTLSAEPYYWYGYGTGGVQQTTLAEAASSSTRLGNGIGDINRNGLFTDTVGVYRGSVTETHRPGVTFKANYTVDNHRILAGYWFERARHRQTQPATTVDNAGNIGDLWLGDHLVMLNNGTTYQGRDWLTISTGSSAFITDTISLANDKLQIVPGLRYTSIKRDFNNYASFGSGMGANYEVERTYSKTLGSVGVTYKVTEPLQVFANVTQNMRAPSNFVLSGWVSSVTYANGAPTVSTLKPNDAIKAETSTNFEAGLRYTGEWINSSIALYEIDFKNRIAQGYNPITATYSDYNVGDSKTRGFELQAGTKPVNGISAFGSLTYTDSKIDNDFPSLKGTTATMLPTSGKVFPDTPKWMAAISLQYSSGPLLAAISGKYTGKRYTTLVNDESLDSFTKVDFDAGYVLPSTSFFKKPTFRLNVSNLFNKKYLLANSGSGSNVTATLDTSYRGGGTPTYYVGAPRFTSLTFSTEF